MDILSFLGANKIRIALFTLIISLVSAGYIMLDIIDDRNGEIGDLKGLLAKSNSETIREIEKCNNDKVNSKLIREKEELLLLLKQQKESKRIMLEVIEEVKKESEIISVELDKFKDKKCLNEKVDVDYLNKVKELLK